MTNDEEPLQHTMPMKPGFAEKYSRDQVLGSPIRERLDEDAMMTGVVVDWIDESAGVTLVIEQRDFIQKDIIRDD